MLTVSYSELFGCSELFGYGELFGYIQVFQIHILPLFCVCSKCNSCNYLGARCTEEGANVLHSDDICIWSHLKRSWQTGMRAALCKSFSIEKLRPRRGRTERRLLLSFAPFLPAFFLSFVPFLSIRIFYADLILMG